MGTFVSYERISIGVLEFQSKWKILLQYVLQTKEKGVYPWLKKEVLQWHIRRLQDINEKKIISTKQVIYSKGKSIDMETCKVCLHIQQTIIMIYNANNVFFACWCILQDEQTKICGRPRGSTIVKSKERNKNFFDMLNYVSQKYDESKLNGINIKKGMFEEKCSLLP